MLLLAACSRLAHRGCDPHGKSLIRKLINPNPALRLGALKNGVEGIKLHRWFAADGFDWSALLSKSIPAPYVPSIKDPLDMEHFDAQDDDVEVEVYADSQDCFEGF